MAADNATARAKLAVDQRCSERNVVVVWNAKRTAAIVIRHDGQNVRLVPMRPGRLVVSRCTRAKFDAEWQPHACPLGEAVATFLAHAGRQGATSEVLKGLRTLAVRDLPVIRPLF